jgi:hypothetical protein
MGNVLGSMFGAPSAPEIPPPLQPENPDEIIRRALRKEARNTRVDANFLTIKPLTGLGITSNASPSTTTSGTYVPPS